MGGAWRRWLVGGVWMLLLLAVGCGGDGAAPEPPATLAPVSLLQLGVDESAAAPAQAWRAAYNERAEQAAVNLIEGNNNALFADLGEGQLDALLAPHIPEGRGELWFNPVALDGVVILVHAENPLASLTQAQVQGLFSGELGNWSDVGGPDRAVMPLAQERGDGAGAIFARRIMGARPVSINTVIYSDPLSLLQAVAAEPGAIGYSTMSALSGAPDAVKAVAVDGVAPTPQNTATQDYPLTTPLYFVSEQEPQGELRAFLAWLQSAEGQAIVSETVGRIR